MNSFGRAALAACCLLLLHAPTEAQAQEQVLEVRPADRELTLHQPRQVVTLAFAVRNIGVRHVDVEPQLILPAGWRALIQEPPFELLPAQTDVRLVSFLIPQTARAGEYPVTYAVEEAQRPSSHGEYTVQVSVLAAQAVRVMRLDSPVHAIAGERYSVAFAVRNTGNASISARFTTRSLNGAQPQPESGELQLEPGETTDVNIEVLAPRVRRRTDEYLTLNVTAPGTSIADSATIVTQVVPRVSAGEVYHTLPTQLDLGLIARETEGKRTSAWQLGWSGGGTLDAEHRRNVRFRLRGPDVRDRSSFGASDDYSLSYWDRAVAATLGDDIYSLSLLTEPGRYARGTRIGFDADDFGMMAYRTSDRLSTLPRDQTGFNAHYRPTEATQLDMNLLDNRGGLLPADIRSLGSRTQWRTGMTSQLEIARSESDDVSGDALRAAFYDNSHALRYYFTGWRADPDYRGYLRDEEYWSTGFDLPRRRSAGIHGYYRSQRRNVDDDPARPASREQQANLGLDRTLAARTSTVIDFNARSYADRFVEERVDILNRSLRLGLNHSSERLALLYSVERGKTRSRIDGTSFDTTMHTLTAFWQATPRQTYGLRASRDDNTYARRPQGTQTSFGVHASFDLAATSISLDAQRNYDEPDEESAERAAHDDYAPTHYDRRRQLYSTYNLLVQHRRPNGARISLLARRIDGRFPQRDVLLTYSLPFDLPLWRKPDVAHLQGRIYDAETGTGVRDVVVNLDGLAAVSNGDGVFNFPAVIAGSYRLSIDRSNLPVQKVTQNALPMELSMAPRERRTVEIGLVGSVSVGIDVKLHGAEAGDAAAVSPVRGLQNVLVTLRQGERMYRRLTDANGHVQLGGLSPGEWIASIASDAVPEGYEVASRELALRIAPGNSATAEFSFKPVVRSIRMLPPLRLN